MKSIKVGGFLSIDDATVELRALNILVGANGAGKINFIGALKLLGQIVGEGLSRYVGQQGGAANLLLDNAPEIVTHVDALMNQFDVDDLIIVERRGGVSTFSRPDQEELRSWLEENSLGDLWEKNVPRGGPVREER